MAEAGPLPQRQDCFTVPGREPQPAGLDIVN